MTQIQIVLSAVGYTNTRACRRLDERAKRESSKLFQLNEYLLVKSRIHLVLRFDHTGSRSALAVRYWISIFTKSHVLIGYRCLMNTYRERK